MKGKKGFTLIEIIVVVVILAALMAVAVPAIMGYINEADRAKYFTISRSINEEVKLYAEKKMVDNKDKPFSEVVEKLRGELSFISCKK